LKQSRPNRSVQRGRADLEEIPDSSEVAMQPNAPRRHPVYFLFAMLLLLCAPSARAQAVEWSMATEYPATSMPGEGLRFFAEAVARESAGRITIKPAFDAALGIKSAEMIAAVRDGRIAAGDAFAGALGKIDPLFLVSSLPFLAATTADAGKLYEAARPLYARRLSTERQRLLYATPWPPSGLWAKKPVRTPSDLAGLAIRTYDATSTKVFAAAGAAPANLSFADTMPRLADGSVVAVLSSGDGGAGRRLWDTLPHFTEINYAVPLSLATASDAAYTALPTDLQDAVSRAAAATEAHQWRLLEGRLAENYARMAANSVTITKADDLTPELRALLAKSAAEAVAAWKSDVGPEGASLLVKIGR
jgi:TRAP-type C4-dicarboxylate transport system substrate-binding protein